MIRSPQTSDRRGTHVPLCEDALVLWRCAKLFTLAEMAENLDIHETTLKEKCRKLGISRWPHRQFRKLYVILGSSSLSDDDKRFVEHLVATSHEHRFAFPEEIDIRLNKMSQMQYKKKHQQKLLPEMPET